MFSHLTKDFLGNKFSRAIGWPFLAVGILFGTWATFIPQVKIRYDLNDADLGMLLLSMPLGALSMNAMGAYLVNRIGMQRATLFGLFFMCFAFLIPLNVPFFWMLPIGLFLCGSGISITNVAMNTVAGSLEVSERINIISTCHGLFSIGLMLSSIAASTAIGLKVEGGLYVVFVITFVVLGGLIVRKTLLSIADQKEESAPASNSKFTMPTGPLLIMILMGLCNNFTEGTMADWSSVFMRDVIKSSTYFTGWGLAAYSLFMALGRFFGDALIPRYGANKILTWGAVISFIGIMVLILLPNVEMAIIGFSLVGAGVSCAAPILYASSARVPGMKKGAGLAIFNTFAMIGFMVGPVIIGFISEAVSLSFAFMLVSGLCVLWAVLSLRAKLY
ncbi:Fucose permease [Spirosomataceae bacterium TFI 002]|nr:Fucose permease [Spirosomataceae bacterium TFI 002]